MIEVQDLSVRFTLARDVTVHAVTDVSFALRPGRLLALVGESGCGKSVLAAALLGLLPANARLRGTAYLSTSDGVRTELLSAPEPVLSGRVRGRLVGLVPQSAATHLTPVRTAGAQLRETIRVLRPEAGDTALAAALAVELAERVGLDPAALGRYPHELSGGMAQRVAVALALAGDPPLVVADEPTTGLDRPLVDRTVDLLAGLAADGRAVLLITHDLAAAKRVATDVAVMYASRLVEVGPLADVLDKPWHPYTARLLAALPEGGFEPIPGHPPELTALPDGCAFCHRCPERGRSGAPPAAGPSAFNTAVPGVAPCTGDPALRQHGDRWVAAHPPC